MARLLRYLILMWAPFVCIVSAAYYYQLSNRFIIFLFTVYIVIYKPVLNFFRMKEKGILHNRDFLKVFTPLFSSQHARDLFYP